MAKVLFICIIVIVVISLILIKKIFNYYADLKMIKNTRYADHLVNKNVIDCDELSQMKSVLKFGSLDGKHFEEITHKINIKHIDYTTTSSDCLKEMRNLAY